MDPKTINETATGLCWCPVCDEKDQRIASFISVFGDDGGLACKVGVCTLCREKMMKLPTGERDAFMEDVTSELVSRYPRLIGKWSNDYGL
jgi:hypothetical protein